jgi:hypothetical protein
LLVFELMQFSSLFGLLQLEVSLPIQSHLKFVETLQLVWTVETLLWIVVITFQ